MVTGATISRNGAATDKTTRLSIPASTKGTMTPMGYSPAGDVKFFVADCHSFSASYSDAPLVVTDACPVNPNCVYGSITRTWTFKDQYNNLCSYDQIVWVIKPAILFVDAVAGVVDPVAGGPLPAITAITTEVTDCSVDATLAGLPFLDWNCNGAKDAGEDAASGVDYCGRMVTSGAITRMNTCPGSYMLMRSWKLINCENPPLFYGVDQIINVKDTKAPTLSIYFQDYQRTGKVQKLQMNGMCIDEFVYETIIDSREPEGFHGTTGDIGDVVKITPLADLGKCGEASISVKVRVADPTCSKGPNNIAFTGIDLTWGLRLNGMPIGENAPMSIADATNFTLTGNFKKTDTNGDGVINFDDADPFFFIVATDPCGNLSRLKFVVNIIDNIVPTMVCETTKEITLTNTGKALITGSKLSRETMDNCTLEFEDKFVPANPLNGRRLVRFDGDDCWSESLTLTCDHIGKPVKIWVRIIDMMGNFSDCCPTVTVIDKFGPTCPMSASVSVDCNDKNIANPESYFTQPYAYDNCETPTVKTDNVVLNLVCGAGTATKSWTFTDKAGNSVTCTQTVTVTPVLGYKLKPLAGTVMTCGTYDFDKDAEVKAVLNNIKLVNGTTPTCSAPLVEVEKWEYSSSDYCKFTAYVIQFGINVKYLTQVLTQLVQRAI